MLQCKNINPKNRPPEKVLIRHLGLNLVLLHNIAVHSKIELFEKLCRDLRTILFDLVINNIQNKMFKYLEENSSIHIL